MTDRNQSTSFIERYRVTDALAGLRSLDESAAVVCLDDAWARPGRQGAFGVEYPAHDFETTAETVDVVWFLLDAIGDVGDPLQRIPARIVAEARGEGDADLTVLRRERIRPEPDRRDRQLLVAVDLQYDRDAETLTIHF